MSSSRSPSHASSILAEPTLTTSVGDTSRPNPETRESPFIWGSHTKDDLCQIVNGAHEEIVFWRKNVFMLPSGAAGKAYLRKMQCLLSLRVFLLEYAEYNFKLKHLSKIF
jgi:hypothetical protein